MRVVQHSVAPMSSCWTRLPSHTGTVEAAASVGFTYIATGAFMLLRRTGAKAQLMLGIQQ